MIPKLLSQRKRTLVMGVLNVTSDSFSDGRMYFDRRRAIARGLEMAAEGADIIDIGGESTRPGSGEVPLKEELARTIPVIRDLRKRTKALLSIDTRKSEVAEEAIASGADIVNDVSGLLFDPRMARVAARHKADIIIMHSRGTPKTMQVRPTYKDVVKDIIYSLKKSISIAKYAGVRDAAITIDPGIGFGKTVGHNLEILNSLDEFRSLEKPICIGTSRKSFIGKILGGAPVEDRLAGTIASSVFAIVKGANILRVHDVKEMVMAARVADSILKEEIV
jgi:dihydropteroate synthase